MVFVYRPQAYIANMHVQHAKFYSFDPQKGPWMLELESARSTLVDYIMYIISYT
jgi:hypothetical protein